MGTNDIAGQQTETTTLKWGELIFVNGVRPEWLRDDDKLRWINTRMQEPRWTFYESHASASQIIWGDMAVIRLPADHPYYTVQRWNHEHPGEVPLTYWPGGDKAPGDWDGNDQMSRDGKFSYYCSWTHPWDGRGDLKDYDIIGYRKRAETPEAQPEPEWQPDPRTLEYVAQKLRDAGHGDAVDVVVPVDDDVLRLREVLAAWHNDRLTQRLNDGEYDKHPDFRAALAVYRKHKEGGRG